MRTTQMRWDRVKTLLSASRQSARTEALTELTDLRALLVALLTRAGWQAAWPTVRPLLAYAVGYVIAQFASAKLAYAMSPRIAGPSPLFVHGGVAISALLLTPPRRWWRYLLLTFPLILIDAWWLGLFAASTGWWVIVVAYLQVVIMAVVTAGLLRRFAVVPPRFATIGEIARFLAIVALGVVPASLFSTAARYYIWSLGFWFAWRTAYLGFVLGIMTFLPAIVLWVTDASPSLRLVRREQQTEAALLGGATILVSVLVFGTQLQDQVLAQALIYSLAPVLIWAAVRFGPFGLASMLALSTAIAVTGAANNRGPFVASSASDNVLALQLFLLCIGVPLLFLAALVQERKQADTATRASEARYRAIFHSTAIGMAVTDLAGRPLEVNEYVSQMVGYAPDALRAMALRDFTHPDDVADNEALLRRALEGDIGSYQVEKRYRHKDGHIVWGRLSASLVRDLDGQPAYFVIHLEDVTQRKQLEREREAAQSEAERRAEELDRVFEQSVEGLGVYDAAGRLVRTNAALRHFLGLDTAPSDYGAATLGERASAYQPRDLDGHLLAPERVPVPRALQGEVISGVQAMDMQLRTWDGRDVVARVSAAPLRNREGLIVGAVGVFRDHTERQQLRREWEEARASELALREVNERLDTFVTLAAHDLRSPVSVSRMVVERAQQLLLQAANMDSRGTAQGKSAQALIRAAQALDTTAHNLDRLMRLVQQLLDVARVKQGTLVLQRQPVDLAEVVRNCVDEQRLLTPARVIIVESPDPAATGGNSPIVVNADPDRLSQMLTNYLTNAVRYSPEDQPIEVSLQVDSPTSADVGSLPGGPPTVRVSVRDHGPGITLEDQATIWERFQRARTMREAAGGLGLGLYIVRTIVEMHGGQVGVESAPGEGATFWFALPLGPAAV